MGQREGDMIANITRVKYEEVNDDIKIKRANICDKDDILQFIRDTFEEGWVKECEKALYQNPVKCYIAVKDHKVIGFSCYDTTAPGFYGPIGLAKEARGKNVGTRLMMKTLAEMNAHGYIYAIIGWVGDAEIFYRKTLDAEWIPGGEPENSVYAGMIEMD